MLTRFTKSVKSEIEEIERLTKKGEAAFRRAFAEYLKTIKSAAMLKAIRQFLENSDIEGLIAHINKAQKPFAKVFADLMLAAGTSEVAALSPKVRRKLNATVPPGTPKPDVGIEFQIANPRAAEILRSQTMTLIREINEQQRKIVYAILSDAQMTGLSPRDIGRQIVEEIGLTTKQRNAVKNYERLLREGNKEALSRELRDRRMDGKIERGEALTAEQINRMVKSYRARYEKYRGDTIARTESHKTVNAARHEALLQTIEQSGIDAKDVKRQWRATNDPRTRDAHKHLDKDTAKMGEPFVSPSGARMMFPGDTSLGAGASEIIACRCSFVTIFD